MSGKDVNIRKDQARKLWFVLNKLAVDDFLAEVGPVLLKMFPHIIPESYLTQEVDGAHDRRDVHKDCLRHDIMSRIRAPTMADMLYCHDCLNFEDYEDIASEEYDDGIVWGKMFDSITGHSDDMTKQIVEALQALLERYKVQVSCSLTELVSRGVPCMCGRANFVLPASPAFKLRKVGSWVKKSPFQQTPRSSGSSVTRVDLRSYSGGTSFRDNDSRSLSSDGTVVPDYITRFPVRSQYIAAKLDTLSEADAESKSCLKHTDDTVSVTLEESEIPPKSAALGSAPVLMSVVTMTDRDPGQGLSKAERDGQPSEGSNRSFCSGLECSDQKPSTALSDTKNNSFIVRFWLKILCTFVVLFLLGLIVLLAVVLPMPPGFPLSTILESLHISINILWKDLKLLHTHAQETDMAMNEIVRVLNRLIRKR
ncbi:uncharacterized protein [Littorina saxatilis]